SEEVDVVAVQPRASDLAYEELRERILDLRLPPGSLVNELALASDLGMGRMPVREAVARLAIDRFITVLPRRGTVVTQVGLEDVLDIFDAREAIECGAVHIVASRATDEDLATLRRLIEAADRARDGTDHEAFLRDDHAIHSFLVHMVRNSLLQDAADRLLLHNLRFWRTYWASRPAQHATMISHGSLLAALEAGDPEQAEKAMREHLVASRQLLRASL
ncbi:MAG TPA: GntR family transcriptional regulator, partial [Galbitalea sp.]|nr:GntR family transcriptional regulator [Galbitalea sp.]